jgi:hypothetical protein
MSLFPYEDVLTKEIETWSGFADKLPSDDDRVIFAKLLNDCYRYAAAINSQEHPFPAESVIIALLLSQHKIISYLKSIILSKKIATISVRLDENNDRLVS